VNRAELAQRIAAAVARVNGVARLTSAGPVEVATQFAGGKVAGLRMSGDDVEVHIAVDRFPVAPVAADVHEAVMAVLDAASEHRTVRVVVSDVDVATLPARTVR
jgi:hypothetical protein